MKRILIIVIFLLLIPTFSKGADISCGMTITANGTYYLQGNLVCDGTAITVNNALTSVILDGQGYSLTFANTGVGNGIEVIYENNIDLEVKNFTITNGAWSPTSVIYGIRIGGLHHSVNIHDNTINLISGTTTSAGISAGDYSTGSGLNEIYNNTLSITEGGYGINIAGNVDEITWGTIHNNTITHSTTWSGRPSSISMVGGAGNKIYTNNITISAANVNSGAIAIAIGSHVEIYNNTITAGVNAFAVRLIYMDCGSHSAKIHNNIISMLSQNPAGNYSRAIRLRYGSDNNSVYSNIITSGASSDYTEGFHFGGYAYSPSDCGGDLYYVNDGNLFYGNSVILSGTHARGFFAESGSGSATANYLYCNRFEVSDSGSVPIEILEGGNPLDPPNNIGYMTIDNNTLVGGTYKVKFTAGYVVHPIHPVTLCNNGISPSDISVPVPGEEAQDYTITSSPCTYGCGAGLLIGSGGSIGIGSGGSLVIQ